MRKTAWYGITLLIALLSGCRRPPAQPSASVPTAVPAAIVKVGGDNQISTIGAPLEQPVVVQVNDAHGAPVAGASVWFRAGNGASLQPSRGVTGPDGQFTTAMTSGTIAGRYQITAAAKGAGGRVIEMQIQELALGLEQNAGRQINDIYCARCHDPESTPERVSNYDNLSAKPHAFADGAFLNTMSEADLLSIIQHGGPALGKSAEMPPYGRTLSRSDIAALAAYIRAVADPPYRPREIVYAQK